MSNVPPTSIRAAVKTVHAVVGQMPPKDARSRAGCLRRIRTLKRSPSNRRPKVRAHPASGRIANKLRIPWTVPRAWRLAEFRIAFRFCQA